MAIAPIIRLARPGDAEAVQRIYAPFVRDTPVSFELEPPSVEEMRVRIAAMLAQYPWLVCECDGQVAGYVYASAYRARLAYQWSVDVTVYLDAAFRRRGIGTALYMSLFEVLRAQGFYTAHAGITLPNAASIGLHEALGFRAVGVYESVGFKQGAWHDVGWWQLALQPYPTIPHPPLSLDAVQGREDWESILARGLPYVRF